MAAFELQRDCGVKIRVIKKALKNVRRSNARHLLKNYELTSRGCTLYPAMTLTL